MNRKQRLIEARNAASAFVKVSNELLGVEPLYSFQSLQSGTRLSGRVNRDALSLQDKLLAFRRKADS